MDRPQTIFAFQIETKENDFFILYPFFKITLFWRWSYIDVDILSSVTITIMFQHLL